MSPPFKSVARRLLPGPLALLVLAVVVPISLATLHGYDIFFNVAQGRWILAHGFPTHDPFSVTSSGPWFPHEWGFSVLVALAVHTFGGYGPGILGAALMVASLVLLYHLVARPYGKEGLFALLVFALCLTVQWYAWDSVRAYYLGNLLFLVAMWIVWRYRHGAAWNAWLLVPLGLAWANLHGSWMLGPVLMAATVVGRAVDLRAVDIKGRTGAWATLLTGLAAAATPRGFQTVTYPLNLIVKASHRNIAEWRALSMQDGSGVALLLLMLLLVFAIAWSRRLVLASALPAVGLSVAAVMQGRHAPLASFVLAVAIAEHLRGVEWPPVPEALGGAIGRLDHVLERWSARTGRAGWPAAAVVAAAVLAVARPVTLVQRIDPATYPVKALQKLATLPPGRVLNRFRFGAAISVVDGPAYKVFVDGRSNPYPRRIMDGYEKLMLLEPGWRGVIRRYNPDYLVWSRVAGGSPLLEVLALEGGWKPVVETPAGVLWRRVRTTGRPAAPGAPPGGPVR